MDAPLPPEVVAEAQVAYRKVRRYRKSSSTLGLLLLAILFGALEFYKYGAHVKMEKLAVGVLIGAVLLPAHFYFRRHLKRKSASAQETLARLRDEYGSEIDQEAKRGAWLA